MRYIPIGHVKEGMKVAKTIFNEHGVVLLHTNSQLTGSIIKKLEYLGYKGLLIDDEISQDIEYTENFVSQEVKCSISKRLNKVLSIKPEETNKMYGQIDDLKNVISKIVDEMISKRDLNLNLLELKMFDNYTYFHSVNVAIIALAIAYNLRLNLSDMETVGTAALLHDIGKIFIGTDIINKPGKLTDEEYEFMKTHSKRGYDVLCNGNNLSIRTRIAVLSHHEHYDGSGYPNALSGENINLFGRIICVADVFDALTSERSYRKACSVIEAMEFIMANSGKMFDPGLVKIFVSKVYPYPVGCSVKLSNGEVGLVIQNNNEVSLRPRLKIISQDDNRIVDLITDRNYRSVVITGIV